MHLIQFNFVLNNTVNAHVYGSLKSRFSISLIWLNVDFNTSKSSSIMLSANFVFTMRLIQYNFMFDNAGKRARLRVTKRRVYFWFSVIKLCV